MLLVAAIVGILLTALARAWPPFLIKVAMLEAVSLLNTQRADAVVSRATTGYLPTEAAQQSPTKSFAPPYWRDDELVFPTSNRLLQNLREIGAVESDAAPTLSFRIATAASGATVWLCGSRDAPEGFTASPMLHTTVPARYLPHFCRSATPAP
jgi:type II secretory pathway pseudopilin PulG